MRFAYPADSTGSESASVANFLDVEKFGLTSEVFSENDSQSVPESGMLLGLASIAGVVILKQKRS